MAAPLRATNLAQRLQTFESLLAAEGSTERVLSELAQHHIDPAHLQPSMTQQFLNIVANVLDPTGSAEDVDERLGALAETRIQQLAKRLSEAQAAASRKDPRQIPALQKKLAEQDAHHQALNRQLQALSSEISTIEQNIREKERFINSTNLPQLTMNEQQARANIQESQAIVQTMRSRGFLTPAVQKAACTQNETYQNMLRTIQHTKQKYNQDVGDVVRLRTSLPSKQSQRKALSEQLAKLSQSRQALRSQLQSLTSQQ